MRQLIELYLMKKHIVGIVGIVGVVGVVGNSVYYNC